jgi:predicted O-methyltransferase YrrM
MMSQVVRTGIAAAVRAAAVERLRTAEFSADWTVADSVPGWLDELSAAVIHAVIAESRSRVAVEIGSYLGRSTTLIALALRRNDQERSALTSIDPHTGDRQHLEKLRSDELPSLALFLEHLRLAEVEAIVDVRVALSEEVGPSWAKTIDFLYVDGWHSYDAVMADIRNFAGWLSDTGVVCFDDFGNYREVREAVRDGCAESGLAFYGQVLTQGWAGRHGRTPAAIAKARRWLAPIHTLSRSMLTDG